jgi:hypothetical protein
MLPALRSNRSGWLPLVSTVVIAAGCGDRSPQVPTAFARIADPDHQRNPTRLARVGDTLWVHAVTYPDDPAQDGSSVLVAIAADGAVREVATSLPWGYAALGEGGLVIAGQPGPIWRVDPDSGAADRVADLGRNAIEAIATGGRVVVSHMGSDGPALFRIDPRTGEQRRVPAPVPGVVQLSRLAEAGGSVFAATNLQGTVIEVLPDDTVRERAAGQERIACLAATASHLVWFRQPEADASRWEIVGQPLAGGELTVLATYPAENHSPHCAAGADAVFFTRPGRLARLVPGGGIGAGPATAQVMAMTTGGDHLFWIEKTEGGWAVRRAPLRDDRR